MIKPIKYFIIFMSVIVFFISGCGGSDDSDGSGTVLYNVVEKTVSVTGSGSLDMTTQSGVTVKAEKETFNENVNVRITESENTEGLSSLFTSASKLYTISAEKTKTSTFGEEIKTKVTNISKAIAITIPNTIGKPGVYYIGVRDNSYKDWNYLLINNNNSIDNPVIIPSRNSVTSNNSPEFVLMTYNVDFQFTLFYATEEQLRSLPEAEITGFKAEAAPLEYETENDHYAENLTVNIAVSGDNINSISASDYIVEIGFMNNDCLQYNSTIIPVYGANPAYKVSHADAGSGNSYRHTITLNSIRDLQNSTLSFGLELTKVSPKLFPPDFTVTLKVNGSPKVLAYEKTQGITLTEKKHGQDEPEEPEKPEHEITYINVVSTNPANGSENVATSSGQITITFDKELADNTDWDSLFTLKTGTATVPVDYEYRDRTLTVTYSSLEEDKIYTALIAEGVSGAEEYSQTARAAFAFSTGSMPAKPEIIEADYINIVETSPVNGFTGVATEPGNIITVKFDKDLAPDNDWESFVSLTGTSGSATYVVSYEDRVLTIEHDGLMDETIYTVFIKAGMKGTEPNSESRSAAFSFTTRKHGILPVTASVSSPAATTEVPASAAIVIEFSDEIDWQDESSELVTMKADNKLIACDYSYESGKLTVTPSASLLFNTEYTLNVSKYLRPVSENEEMVPMQFSFTTENNEATAVITGDETKTSGGKYFLTDNLKFSVEFSRPITDTEKAKNQFYLLKNCTDQKRITVDFDPSGQMATVTIPDALESETDYTLGFNEFTDSDNTTVRPAQINFTGMTGITVESFEINYGEGWVAADGCSNLPNHGSARISFSMPVAPSAAKLVYADGSERTVYIENKTEGNSATIEFDYSRLAYGATFGLMADYTDSETGQVIKTDIHTFQTGLPEELDLQNPEKPNSEENPYIVCSALALDQIRGADYINSGYYFKQLSDIDLATSTYVSETNTVATGWTPIGDAMTAQFLGYYDGNGKVIRNLTCSDEESQMFALFGGTSGATISNLGLEDVNITADTGAAPLACYAISTTITNCYASGQVTSSEGSGGLIAAGIMANVYDSYSTVTIKSEGQAGGIISVLEIGNLSNCYYSGNIEGVYDTGGLIGDCSQGTIRNCYVISANIEGTSYSIGGLIGNNYEANIIDSYLKDSTVTGGDNIGGILGQNCGSITGCYTQNSTIKTNDPSNSADGAGGLTGSNDSTISECHVENTEILGNYNVGGLIGYNSGYIENSYAKEITVNGTNDGVGGITGTNERDYYSEPETTGLANCSAEGTVSGNDEVGGLVGKNDASCSVLQSNSHCTVTGNSMVGGLVGHNKGVVDTESSANGSVDGSSLVGDRIGFDDVEG